MNSLLRYLFVVQHDYPDSARASRARVILLLTSGTAIMALIYGVFMTLVAVAGIELRSSTTELVALIAPVLIVWSFLALWLLQRGQFNAAALMIGSLLWSLSLFSLFRDGLVPRAIILLPAALAYSGLIYGTKGTVFAMLLAWISLPLTAYLQAEGQTSAQEGPLDELMYEALVTAGMLALSAILLWIFAWNSQRALVRANRIATQTRAIAEAGQIISRILNLDELLTYSVDLVRDRFAFFHVQIYMVDEQREYANLAASTGQIGLALLAQGFRVAIGPRTVVGDAIANRDVRYVGNIVNTPYRHPQLLADARTVLVIPLFIGDDVVGALEIQSMRLNALSSEDIETMRVMANQLSQAIQNARLFEAQQHGLLQNRRLFLESETNLAEIERLNRQLTGQSWQEYLLERDRSRFSIQLIEDEIATDPVDWTPAMRLAVDHQRLVSRESGDKHILAIPISIRGQAVGAIEVHLPDRQSLSEARTMLQAVSERVAFSLENARLFEEAQIAAEREQQINLITARLQGLTSIEDVLTMAVGSLGQALQAEQGAIRLLGRDQVPPVDRTNGSQTRGAQPGDGASPGSLTSED
jgi:GAF domain-containing protein